MNPMKHDKQEVLGHKYKHTGEIHSFAPNMDEVVRQVKEALENSTGDSWYSTKNKLIIFSGSDKIAQAFEMEDGHLIANSKEWLRLLIEERERDKAEIEKARSLRDFAVKKSNELIAENERQARLISTLQDDKKGLLHSLYLKRNKVAEQDKEIQRLQGELSEQQEISHNFHRMANEYHHDIQHWRRAQIAPKPCSKILCMRNNLNMEIRGK
jgi:hypothetical protein